MKTEMLLAFITTKFFYYISERISLIAVIQNQEAEACCTLSQYSFSTLSSTHVPERERDRQ